MENPHANITSGGAENRFFKLHELRTDVRQQPGPDQRQRDPVRKQVVSMVADCQNPQSSDQNGQSQKLNEFISQDKFE